MRELHTLFNMAILIISTAFFVFGQMVLVVALLKITKICCLFIPTSAEVYDRNLWYNQIQTPPTISTGKTHVMVTCD